MVRAYALYDREVGYCQGITNLAGVLLLHMPDEVRPTSPSPLKKLSPTHARTHHHHHPATTHTHRTLFPSLLLLVVPICFQHTVSPAVFFSTRGSSSL